jgi:hypothetical protein
VPVVYAHSADELYSINPDTLEVALVGPFAWPGGGADQMTDIALDQDGRMVGISFGSVYSIDPETAVCQFLAHLEGSFNGLSFLEVPGLDGAVEELVAVALDGTLWTLDPMTGASTQRGSYGGGLGSSGDLVYVRELGAFATVRLVDASSAFDGVARVDPATGAATLLGNGQSGFSNIWGLAYWGSRLFGFTEGQEFVVIEVMTGTATLVETSSARWWGAGVTTRAPVVGLSVQTPDPAN